MHIVKQQHIVPKFYLKYFTNENGEINVLDIVSGKVYSTNPTNTARIGKFYDIEETENPEEKQLIEKKLNELETETAPIYRSMINGIESGTFSFDENSKKLISKLIINLMLRTDKHRSELQEMFEDIEKQLIEKAGPEFAGTFTESNLTKRQQHLYHLASELHTPTEEMDDRLWIIIKNKTSTPFYTSDNPAVGYSHGDIINQVYEISLPLTPWYLLCIFIKYQLQPTSNHLDRIIEVDNLNLVNNYNHLISIKCSRNIFSVQPDFSFAKEVLLKYK